MESTLNILNIIAQRKRIEVEAAKALLPHGLLLELVEEVKRTPVSLSNAITASSSGVIAEFKRRSPSMGEIAPLADPGEITRQYQQAGAAACSVLTDTPFFGGAISDLQVARQAVKLPLLRKDFTIDPYMIAQARLAGADAVLLIAAILTPHQVGEMAQEAHRLGLETILELHSADELRHVCSEVDVVGVNSRDLRNFNTNLDVAKAMVDSLPQNVVKIAESGIHHSSDLAALRSIGYNGFLIGQSLMSTPNPGNALTQLINGTL